MLASAGRANNKRFRRAKNPAPQRQSQRQPAKQTNKLKLVSVRYTLAYSRKKLL